MRKQVIFSVICVMGLIVSIASRAQFFDDEIFTADLEDHTDEQERSDTVRKKERCKKLCNLWVRNCLRAGALKVGGNAVIGGDLTVTGTINNNSSVNVPCEFPRGLDGQVYLGVTNAAAVFNYLTSSDDSITFDPGPGTLGMTYTSYLGNVARVDQILGHDTGAQAGSVNGRPFKTITAALAAAGTYATPTTPVTVWVMPGIYSNTASSPETFPLTIPASVSLVGLSAGQSAGSGGVTIQDLNATANTTLVSMGTNSSLEQVSLALSSSNGSALEGIAIPTGPATIKRVGITVSGGATATSYGIFPSGMTNIDSSTINSNGRGIYVTAAATVEVSNSSITAGTIGIETANAGASVTANTSTMNGATADISKTLGTITLANGRLYNSSANNLNFANAFLPSTITWATSDSPVMAGTNFMTPGTGAVESTNPAGFGIIIPQQIVARNLRVNAVTPPGTGTAIFTLYKNGAPITPVTLSVTLAASDTAGADIIDSVTCMPGDILSIQLINSGTTLGKVTVSLEVY